MFAFLATVLLFSSHYTALAYCICEGCAKPIANTFPGLHTRSLPPINPLRTDNIFIINEISAPSLEDCPLRTELNSSIAKSAMISVIKFYKREISPLLPPACRFYPTCSIYAMESIEEFGPAKGIILMVWRLLRCTPLGGYGYDPPKWPPPGWFAGIHK